MWRWTVRDLLTAGQRWWVLLVTLVVASSGFSILTAQSVTTQLQTTDTVVANSRGVYDILIRPARARSQVEEQLNLVQPDFLSSYESDITMDQWAAVKKIPGVEVAAPIGLVGWASVSAGTTVDARSLFSSITAPTLVRVTTTYRYDNGASAVAVPQLYYVTPNPVTWRNGDMSGSGPNDHKAAYLEAMPDGTTRIHYIATDPLPYHLISLRDGPCLATEPCGATRSTKLGQPFPLQYVLAAVDPASEAALTSLDKSVTSGGYLTSGALTTHPITTSVGTKLATAVPVLVSNAPGVEVTASYQTDDLGGEAAAAEVAGQLDGTTQVTPKVDDSKAVKVATASVASDAAFATFVADMSTPTTNGAPYAAGMTSITRVSGLTFATDASGTLQAQTQKPTSGEDTPGVIDTPLRTQRDYILTWEAGDPVGGVTLVKQGTFDASRLADPSLGRVPTGITGFDLPTGADAASQTALGNRAWQPTPSVMGYVQPAAMMLTTLDGLTAFTAAGASGMWLSQIPNSIQGESLAPVAEAPLSAIRVRVSGVSGFDAAARERVRVVAEDIAKATGLTVDIMMGASPASVRIAVPAGAHGRPALVINDQWVKKGVAVQLIAAADRKTLLLNTGILVVSGVVVNNAVFAQVRSRRRHIGVLRTVGWTGWNIFAWIMGGVALVSLAAGLLGAGLAATVTSLFGLALNPTQMAWAIPAALAVGLLAATTPAIFASSVPAMAATFATGARTRRGRRGGVFGVAGMALRAVRLGWGRSTLAILALGTATAALGVLWTIQHDFSGRAAGTLLGDALTLQVQGPDLVATAGMLLLAGVGVSHALAIEIRERGSELATLTAVGWTATTLTRMLALQAATLGLLGGLVGIAMILWFDAAVLGTLGGSVAFTALLAGSVSILTALVGALLPAAQLQRLPAATVLAEE